MTHREFLEYCRSFYSEDGLYRCFFSPALTYKELTAAVALRMATAPDFEGDSIDREAVRDIMLHARKIGRRLQSVEDRPT